MDDINKLLTEMEEATPPGVGLVVQRYFRLKRRQHRRGRPCGTVITKQQFLAGIDAIKAMRGTSITQELVAIHFNVDERQVRRYCTMFGLDWNQLRDRQKKA